MLQKAINAYKNNELLKARNYLVTAVSNGQSNDFVLGFLATIEKALGNNDEAIRLFKASLKANPNNADFLHNYSILLAEIDSKKALDLSNKAILIEPKNSKFLQRNGHLRWKAGDLVGALSATLKALNLDPNSVEACVSLADIYADSGDLNEALSLALKCTQLQPKNPSHHIRLFNIYYKLGKLNLAVKAILKSIELQHDNAIAHMLLGGLYKDLGNLDQALAATLTSIKINPRNPNAYLNLGCLYDDLGNLDQALVATQKSIELQPKNIAALTNLSHIYKDLGSVGQALACAIEAIKLDPENARAIYTLGSIKAALGDIDTAKKYFLQAIELNPKECGAYHELSLMLTTVDEAEKLLRASERVQLTELNSKERSALEFSIANCYHQTKDFQRSALHLKNANNHKLLQLPSNATTFLDRINHSLLEKNVKSGNIQCHHGNKRIFIVGMPRSGSTLLELVLSTNTLIQPLGETRALERAIIALKNKSRSDPSPKTLDDLYSHEAPIKKPSTQYTTDKQLYNFIHTDLIATQLPAAKIIHCFRDPLDNVLSMYKSNLGAGNNYTSNIEDAAKILIAQTHAMKIHKGHHPDKIYQFDYGAFVNSPEPALQELLEWLDIEWNPSYLQPNQRNTLINTASKIQARRPIHNQSIGTSNHYSELLKPAADLLEQSGLF